MGADFIPERDRHAAYWMRTFARKIVAAPAAYQLSAADAAGIDAVVQSYRAALAVALKPDERTVVTVRT